MESGPLWLRATKLVVISTVVAVLTLVAVVAVAWWLPKAQFACDRTPWGPSTAREAVGGFVASIVEQDGALACSVSTSRHDETTAPTLVKTSAASLGDPRNTDEITVSMGEQMGATTPATLHTAEGELPLDVQSYGNQWRVQFVESLG